MIPLIEITPHLCKLYYQVQSLDMENEENNILLLDSMPTGSKCVIVKVNGYGGLRHRLMEMGFVKGEVVTVVKNAPLLDPVEYKIMAGHVSLRREEAQKIQVVALGKKGDEAENYNGMVEEEAKKAFNRKSKEISVALVGNPNCGKTSFFNHATGLHEKVGNYSGVTIDMKIGEFHHNGYTINLIDLPGTYSITEYTPEELYVREFITKQNPDIVLNIVDASNLERNLYLTTQLIDMNVRMVMALNMYDELSKRGDKFDHTSMSEMLGFPIIPTTASKGTGIIEVLQTIIDVYENEDKLTRHIHVNYGLDIEEQISKVKSLVANTDNTLTSHVPVRSIAINLIEGNKITIEEIAAQKKGKAIIDTAQKCRKELENRYNEDAATTIVNARYAFIRGALKETFEPNPDTSKTERPYSIDRILTHRWLGFPVLLIFLWMMFQATFTLGAPLQEWIEQGVSWLGEMTGKSINDGILKDLIVDGIIAGVGGVIVFLPNILILFMFISILEDTGYMARAAFIIDKLMHRIGLHGKSFIPFLIGFGCGVPAIMATRTLENKKDRILTIIGIPFMSCSARLPVYLLLVGAFFGKSQGLILLSIYLIGIMVAVLTALILKNTVFKDNSEHFVMELPPYRMPTLRNTLIHMWDKSVQYLKKMGTVILAASIVIWTLGYFPRHSAESASIAQRIVQVENDKTINEAEKAEMLSNLSLREKVAQSENSYIGRMGRFVAPVVAPLGFDWKMGVSLITGMGAKEIVVSTMGVLYQADDDADENSTALITKLQEQHWTSGPRIGQPVFTPLVAYVYMLFILLYFPCIAAIAAIRREAGRGWMWFSVIYNTAIAWLICFAVYQIGILF